MYKLTMSLLKITFFTFLMQINYFLKAKNIVVQESADEEEDVDSLLKKSKEKSKDLKHELKEEVKEEKQIVVVDDLSKINEPANEEKKEEVEIKSSENVVEEKKIVQMLKFLKKHDRLIFAGVSCDLHEKKVEFTGFRVGVDVRKLFFTKWFNSNFSIILNVFNKNFFGFFLGYKFINAFLAFNFNYFKSGSTESPFFYGIYINISVFSGIRIHLTFNLQDLQKVTTNLLLGYSF